MNKNTESPTRIVRPLVITLLVIVLMALGAVATFAQSTSETGNVCVQDYQSGAVCTANDVRLASLSVVSFVNEDTCSFAGDTATVIMKAQFIAGAQRRYDVGFFIAQDGGSAKSGDSCYHDFLNPVGSPTDLLSGNGPFANFETADPGDVCGDIEQNAQNFYLLEPFTIACTDANADGEVDPVSTCTSWDNNAVNTCAGVTDAFPGTNSKCSCESVTVPELDIRKIIVDKITTPNETSTFPFNFTISKNNVTAANFNLSSPQDPVTTPLAAGIYSVVEADASADGWTLVDSFCYASTSPAVHFSPNSVDLTQNIEVRCQFTNNAGPNAVAISSVTATDNDNVVEVAWETVSESDLAGFNVYRSRSDAGPWSKINPVLIASATPGASMGGSYQFVDRLVSPSTLYYYRLEAVQVDGSTQNLDVVSVAFQPGVRRWLPSFFQ